MKGALTPLIQQGVATPLRYFHSVGATPLQRNRIAAYTQRANIGEDLA